MGANIHELVMNQPLFDAHMHVASVPEYAAQPARFTRLLGYAAADLQAAAGPRRPGRPALPPEDDPGYTSAFFQLWAKIRNTSYARATERACRDVLGLEFTEENAEAVGEAYERFRGDDPMASYTKALRDCAGVADGSRDPVRQPEEVAEGQFPDFLHFSYRNNELVRAVSREVIFRMEADWKRSIHTLTDLDAGYMDEISAILATGRVTAFKIGVAYARSLDFAFPTRHEAEVAFDRVMRPGGGAPAASLAGTIARPKPEETRLLEDYLIHRTIQRAAEENVGVQIHTGYLAGNWSNLAHTNPMGLTPLLGHYRSVRFDLFHAGWPFHNAMAAIGKEFPNVWVDLCWAWAMSAAAMEQALDVFLDAVPCNKIIGYGSDTRDPLLVYGYAAQARDGIARTLQRRIDRGVMDEALALEVARAVMLENGLTFHGIGAG